MMNHKTRKTVGLIIDVLMYMLFLMQMLYVFTGNDLHEWMGIGFFVCLIFHLVLKRKWFSSFYKRKSRLLSGRRVADALIILLLLCLCVLMLSSMGVSRTLFPWAEFCGNPDFHRILATVTLTLAVLHGGMHGYLASKKKKKIVIGMISGAVISLCLGFWMVPYLNRHFRTVEIDLQKTVSGEHLNWNVGKPLVVYFTRVGNTDFDEEIDAVSGASLLLADGELMGNTQLMAEMLHDILSCDVEAITITGEKYPSSYAKTCDVGGKEIKNKVFPEILPIDISDYDSVILVYPIWWYTLPMPVASFLRDNNFDGKDIYLVATQGSNGFGSSIKDAQALVPSANVKEAISVYCDDIPDARDMLMEWIVKNELGK